MDNEIVLQPIDIENKIVVIRGQQVMLDRDLAELYGVETKVLNQAVKRNIERFPTRFMFQLTLKHSTRVHDRFLIIDIKTLYHIGASLKDLGKKCFAFEVLDSAWIKEILKNL